MVAGDSLHERKVGVAQGFPIRQLKRDEAITTNDVLSVLGADIGDQMQVSVSNRKLYINLSRFHS